MSKPEPLIFPKGVRFPRGDEIPADQRADVRARISEANITIGYIRNDDGGDSFTTYFEANVHAPEVFEVFCDLAISILPEVAAPIVGLKDEEPIFGPYTTREGALKVFEPHADLLQNDGFLEFGVIFAFEDKTEEIYVKSSKYLQIWTNQPEAVAKVLARHNTPRALTLQFIDEYPMVSESIDNCGSAAWPEVMDVIRKAFETLPKVSPP